MEPVPPDRSPAGLSPLVRSTLIPCLLIAGAALAVYSNCFSVPFLLDDTGSILENASIRRLWPLTPVLAPPAHAGVGGRPIANLTFALNHALGGFDVRGYHFVNLAIHLGAALALFGLVRRTLALPRVRERLATTDDTAATIALGAALLWALHPLQTETVTYISQRTEALMALFYLTTLYCFVRATQSPGVIWKILAAGSCTLGMATKEVMVTAPVMVFLYDRTFVAGTFRAAWQQRRWFHLVVAATWLLLLFLLADVQERGVGHVSVAWWEYALTSSRAILHYLRLAIWPAPLIFDYGTEVVRSVVDAWPQLLGLAALVATTLLALWRRPMLGFGGAWIFALLAPATSIVPVAGQTMAEHRMYLPLAALAVGAALVGHRWIGARAIFATATAAVLLGGATFVRNRDYRDAVTLWTDTVEKRPQNARAHASLGAALLGQGQLRPAIAALERALHLNPGLAEAHNNLATALLDVDRTADAVAHFAAALKLRPGTASTHYNFGNALLALGRTTEAIAQQQQALILQPEFPEASCALANALFAAGRLDEAIARYRDTLRLRPDLTAAHFGLANALAQSGRPADSVPYFETTLRAVPKSVEAHYNLGNVLLALGRAADAVRHYTVAVELKPDFAEAHVNLASALAQSGRTAEAIAHCETALKLQPGLEAARRNLEVLRRPPSR